MDIKLGDIVRVKAGHYYGGCFGKVIGIKSSKFLILVDPSIRGDYNVDSSKFGWLVDEGRCKEIETDYSPKEILDGSVRKYIGEMCWYLPGECSAVMEVIAENAVGVANQVQRNLRCSSCGMVDEYASPSAKHNNEVRCYRCY